MTDHRPSVHLPCARVSAVLHTELYRNLMLVRLHEVWSHVILVYCSLNTSIFTFFYALRFFLVGLGDLKDLHVFSYNVYLLVNAWPFGHLYS